MRLIIKLLFCLLVFPQMSFAGRNDSPRLNTTGSVHDDEFHDSALLLKHRASCKMAKERAADKMLEKCEDEGYSDYTRENYSDCLDTGYGRGVVVKMSARCTNSSDD